MTHPVVSVLMPVRNGAAYVADAMESILAQTLRTFELLVMDDGSQDATPAIVAGAASRDARVRVVAVAGQGIVPALNTGLAEARGRYIARMDADDVAMPERLARQVATLDAFPNVAVVGSACRVIDHAGTVLAERHPPTAHAEIRSALMHANCMIHPTVMMRRDAVVDSGGYRAAFRLAEDFDLWLRLSERHDLLNLSEPLLDYRQHGEQSSWHDAEQRSLSELGALACAERRRTRGADGVADVPCITREVLRELGVADTLIEQRIIACALGSAKDAIDAGQRVAARAALALLLRQPHLHPRTRLHGWLLRLRAVVA